MTFPGRPTRGCGGGTCEAQAADRTTEERKGDLRRRLGYRDLVVHGLLFIAPKAPVGVYGTLDAKSHGAVAFVYAVATAATAFTAFSYGDGAGR